MRDVWLKFDDQTAALAALATAGIVPVADEAGNSALPSKSRLADGTRFGLSICGQGTGTIYEPTGDMVTGTDEDGNTVETEGRAPVLGYHINMRFDGAVPAGLAAYDIAPQTPAERFA
ncbi:hypothetical protein FJU08_22655 [Martelella alba]|uniref:Uncharacterized protein n=1 Tax=Martelella alba TaxID=2590451 RepID=A0A506TVE6_9HYPH|nr:hypothetical protein [Martelella alba]TPW26052.1 hypothetical protein FJU08_22655 [Martelella alba]